MSDAAAIKHIVVTALEMAQKVGAARIAQIQLVIGRSSKLSESNLLEGFKMMASGTLAEDARLTISRDPSLHRCLGCGLEFKSSLSSQDLLCPDCGSYVMELAKDYDYYIGEVEIVPSKKL